MKSLFISILLLISIVGTSQSSQKVDTLQSMDTIFYPDNLDPNVRVVDQIMPEFPGGPDSLIAFAKKHITYPQSLIKDNIQGEVVIRFCVDENGIAGNVGFIRTLHPLLEKQCTEMVRDLPLFKPGTMLKRSEKGLYWGPFKAWVMMSIYFSTTNINPNNRKIYITP